MTNHAHPSVRCGLCLKPGRFIETPPGYVHDGPGQSGHRFVSPNDVAAESSHQLRHRLYGEIEKAHTAYRYRPSDETHAAVLAAIAAYDTAIGNCPVVAVETS